MKIFSLILSIFIAHLAGVIGSVFTVSSVDTWFVLLDKPLWNPPGWVFGPVWLLLYTLMGIAAYCVWQRRKEKPVRAALVLYGVQLFLNAFWSVAFFGLQNPALAFFDIILLLICFVITSILFFRIDRIAAVLMMPYALWVGFALFLNYTIWMLN